MHTCKKIFRPHESRMNFLWIGLPLIILILSSAFDPRLFVRSYMIDSPEISEQIRIALITDLHSCRYGKEQINLIRAIDRQNPDVILLGGDIFDDVMDDENTEHFIKGIAGRYPCYYVTGNHECWSGTDAFADKMKFLEKYGIPVLSGNTETLSIRGETIFISGIDDPDFYRMQDGISGLEAETRFLGQLDAVGSETTDGIFSVLLSHRPEYWTEYIDYDFDLILCGHAHGGQWRIPFLINGVFAPDQGLFPEYAGGKYEENGTSMIVSRGLARESTRIPRIFNRPELVIVDIE